MSRLSLGIRPVPWQGFTTKGPTRLGDNVWCGAHVVITSGVTVGERCVIGANSVVVIEHNLDVIKVSDRIIDLGPEGGDEGGSVIATGTPEQVADVSKSYTGRFLAGVLPGRERPRGRTRRRAAERAAA